MARNKKSKEQSPEDLLGYAEVGRMFNKSPQTIRRWVLDGLIPAVRLPTGVYQMRRDAVMSFFSGTPIRQVGE